MDRFFPMRLSISDRGEMVPEFPGECEIQCVHSDEIRAELGDYAFIEYLDRMARTRDERQCRGCGRWGIFERRAIPANLPDGSVVRGLGFLFTATAEGAWMPLGLVDGFVQRPARACPCCTGTIIGGHLSDDCWCVKPCASTYCQAGEGR